MFLVAIAFIGSLALKVLTVVNEAVHEAAFSMVKATSTLMLGEVRATKILGASPAQKYAAAASKRTEAVKRISTRVTRRLVLNSVRNVTSMAAEVVPVVGVAVVVAVTVADLHDNCQTVKDLNEMRVAVGETIEDESIICGMKVPRHQSSAATDKK